MPRTPSDDEYDSDSGSDISVTDVQLGLGDGPLEGDDEANPLVSRIGGRAAWLPMTSPPPRSVSECAKCNKPMQLLVQIFAPLVDSPFDRCLLVWGCARAECQRTNASSVKVVRVLKHNPRWAAKLEKQRAKRETREAREREREAARKAREEEQARLAKVNPFSANASTGAQGGLGGMLFGAADGNANPFAAADPPKAAEPEDEDGDADTEDEDDDDDDDDEDDEAERLAEELAIKAALETQKPATADADWVKQVPKYPALYLNTIPEPAPEDKEDAEPAVAVPESKLSTGAGDDDSDLAGWGKESYERALLDGIDSTFERFIRRVGLEGRQVVRYEFGGVPLPFHARGRVYTELFPSSRYSEAAIPPCPACGAARTFEVQLMPNLVNLLRPEHIDDQQEQDESLASLQGQERTKAEIERALGRTLDASGKVLDSRTGIVWSTAMVYVCSKDCCIPRAEDGPDGETWREEWIGVQFEDEQ